MDKLNTGFYFFNNTIRDKEKKSGKPELTPQDTIASKKIFSDLLEQTESVDNPSNAPDTQEEISVLLKDIGIQGKRFKQHRTMENLEEYKRMIRKLLGRVIESAENVSVKTLYNPIRKEKSPKLHFSIIDNELLHLTKIFMEEQNNVLKIASQIDKIEGILLDLAF